MVKENPYLKPLATVPADQKPIYRVSKRPKYSNIALLAVAIIFLVFGKEWVSWGVGIFVLLITIYSFFNLKEAYVADIYSDFVVIYSDEDPSNCEMITWNQITKWEVHTGNIGTDMVILHLDNDQETYIISYSAYGITTHFNKKIRDKYHSNLQKGQKFQLRDIADMFKRKKD